MRNATPVGAMMSPTKLILIMSTSMLLGTFITGAIGVPLHVIPVRIWSYEVAVFAGINVVIWLAASIWKTVHAKRS